MPRHVPFALVVAAMAATSAAADSSWIAPKDGLFADPGRWSNGVPGLGATAIFGVTPGGPFTVTTAGTQVVGGLSVTNQLVMLNAAGGTFVALGAANVGSKGGDGGLSMRDGSFLLFGGLEISHGATLETESASLEVKTISVSDGLWTVAEGTSVTLGSGAVLIGRGEGNAGEWRIAEDATIVGEPVSSPVALGTEGGTGTLRIEEDVTFTLPTRSFLVGGTAGQGGQAAPGIGAIVLEEGATLVAPWGIALGYYGPGEVVLEGTGQTIDAPGIGLGAWGGSAALTVNETWTLKTLSVSIGFMGGFGSLTVAGAGTTLDLTGPQAVGIGIGNDALGSLIVSDGAIVATNALRLLGSWQVSIPGRIDGSASAHLFEGSLYTDELMIGGDPADVAEITATHGSDFKASVTTFDGNDADVRFVVGPDSSISLGPVLVDSRYQLELDVGAELAGPNAAFHCDDIVSENTASSLSLALGPDAVATIASIHESLDVSVAWTIDGASAPYLSIGVPHLLRGALSVTLGPRGAPPPGSVTPLASGVLLCTDLDTPIVVEQPDDGSVYLRATGTTLELVRPRERLALALDMAPSLLAGLSGRVHVHTVDGTELIDVTDLATLESSDPNVVSITRPGVVRGVSPGSAVVTARLGNAVIASKRLDIGLDPALTPFELATGTGSVPLKDGGFSGVQALSADGRLAVFVSSSPDVVEGDDNGATDVFLFDRDTGSVVRVSEPTGGGSANGESSIPVISADGRYVAFPTRASNLVGDSQFYLQVVVKDLWLDSIEVLSVAADGSLANGNCGGISISGDGRFIAYESDATNLVAGDTNGPVTDVLVHDRLTGETTRLGLTLDGSQPVGGAVLGGISSDGRWIAYLTTEASAARRIIVLDRATNERTVESQGLLPKKLAPPSISDDGRWVAFTATSFVAVACHPNNPLAVVHLRDRQTGEVTIPWPADATPAFGSSNRGTLTADGRYLFFVMKRCGDQCPDGFGPESAVRFETATGVVVVASSRAEGPNPTTDEIDSAISASADGRTAFFASRSKELVPLTGPTTSQEQPYIRRFGPLHGADINGDGTVGAKDLAALIAAWGGNDVSADLDENGIVDPFDLAILLGAWNASGG